jgi:hypothetical protein
VCHTVIFHFRFLSSFFRRFQARSTRIVIVTRLSLQVHIEASEEHKVRKGQGSRCIKNCGILLDQGVTIIVTIRESCLICTGTVLVSISSFRSHQQRTATMVTKYKRRKYHSRDQSRENVSLKFRTPSRNLRILVAETHDSLR